MINLNLLDFIMQNKINVFYLSEYIKCAKKQKLGILYLQYISHKYSIVDLKRWLLFCCVVFFNAALVSLLMWGCRQRTC